MSDRTKGNGEGGKLITLGDAHADRGGIVGATLEGAPGRRRLTGISLPARPKSGAEPPVEQTALMQQSTATLAKLRERINQLTTGVISDDTSGVGELCGEVMMLGYVLSVLHGQGEAAQCTYDERMEAILRGGI